MTLLDLHSEVLAAFNPRRTFSITVETWHHAHDAARFNRTAVEYSLVVFGVGSGPEWSCTADSLQALAEEFRAWLNPPKSDDVAAASKACEVTP